MKSLSAHQQIQTKFLNLTEELDPSYTPYIGHSCQVAITRQAHSEFFTRYPTKALRRLKTISFGQPHLEKRTGAEFEVELRGQWLGFGSGFRGLKLHSLGPQAQGFIHE